MAKNLKCAFAVKDTLGNSYVYGCLDTGYMERLDYGNTFDGEDIISKHRIPDIPLAGWMIGSTIRKVRHLAISKSTTTDKVSITHYGDCINTSTTATTRGIKSSTNRIKQGNLSEEWGPYIFHSLECSVSIDNEAIGYEPIGLGLIWNPVSPRFVNDEEG